jgi:hypothetical protein
MNKEFFRRPAVFVAICVEHLPNKLFGRGRLEMEFVSSGFPRPVCAAKHDTVTLGEEHLRGAASEFARVVGHEFVDETNIGNAGSRRRLCLSEIKHAHTDDEVRQEMA